MLVFKMLAKMDLGFLGGASGKEPASQCKRQQEKRVWSLSQEDPLEEEMATHSSILARRILWTKELAGLQPIGLQRVGHNYVWAAAFC